jgi:hypothetical protein
MEMLSILDDSLSFVQQELGIFLQEPNLIEKLLFVFGNQSDLEKVTALIEEFGLVNSSLLPNFEFGGNYYGF